MKVIFGVITANQRGLSSYGGQPEVSPIDVAKEISDFCGPGSGVELDSLSGRSGQNSGGTDNAGQDAAAPPKSEADRLMGLMKAFGVDRGVVEMLNDFINSQGDDSSSTDGDAASDPATPQVQPDDLDAAGVPNKFSFIMLQ